MLHIIIFIEKIHRRYGATFVVSFCWYAHRCYKASLLVHGFMWTPVPRLHKTLHIKLMYYKQSPSTMVFQKNSCIYTIKNQYLNRCHYLFHFLYQSQNKYTLNLCQHLGNHHCLLRWFLQLSWKIFYFRFYYLFNFFTNFRRSGRRFLGRQFIPWQIRLTNYIETHKRQRTETTIQKIQTNIIFSFVKTVTDKI